MSINVVRTAGHWYVQRGGEAFPVRAEVSTTAAELVTAGFEAVRGAASATTGAVSAGEEDWRLR